MPIRDSFSAFEQQLGLTNATDTDCEKMGRKLGSCLRDGRPWQVWRDETAQRAYTARGGPRNMNRPPPVRDVSLEEFMCGQRDVAYTASCVLPNAARQTTRLSFFCRAASEPNDCLADGAFELIQSRVAEHAGQDGYAVETLVSTVGKIHRIRSRSATQISITLLTCDKSTEHIVAPLSELDTITSSYSDDKWSFVEAELNPTRGVVVMDGVEMASDARGHHFLVKHANGGRQLEMKAGDE